MVSRKSDSIQCYKWEASQLTVWTYHWDQSIDWIWYIQVPATGATSFSAAFTINGRSMPSSLVKRTRMISHPSLLRLPSILKNGVMPIPPVNNANCLEAQERVNSPVTLIIGIVSNNRDMSPNNAGQTSVILWASENRALVAAPPGFSHMVSKNILVSARWEDDTVHMWIQSLLMDVGLTWGHMLVPRMSYESR